MSTAEQLQGDSARRQYNATLQYANEHGLDLADVFQDSGVSAFKGKNALFGRLADFLDLAQSGEIEAGSFLIVESLDRISRQNFLKAITLLHEIIRCGITVVTLIDRQEYSTATVESNPYILFIAALTLVRAHEESQHKSVRLSAAWSNKREQARSGIQTKQRIPAWLRFSPKCGAIEAIPERLELLVKIFEMSRDGWGSYSIARKLNDDGIAPWGRAKFWQESYVKKLLSNRSVLGELQPHKMISGKRIPDGKVVKGYYPQVVDPALFAEVQDALVRRRISGRGRKGKALSNLFSGLLLCPICKSGMRFIDKGPPPKGGTYLKCSKAVLSANCEGRSIRYLDAEAAILRILQHINFDAILNGEEWRQLTLSLRVEIQDNEENIAETNKLIENTLDYIGQFGASEKASIRIKSYEAQASELLQRRHDLGAQLAELNSRSRLANEDLIVAVREAGQNGEELHSLRRKLSDEIRKIVKYISILPDEGVPLGDERDWSEGLSVWIAYRNGTSQVYDAISDDNMVISENKKMSLFRERHRLSQLP